MKLQQVLLVVPLLLGSLTNVNGCKSYDSTSNKELPVAGRWSNHIPQLTFSSDSHAPADVRASLAEMNSEFAEVLGTFATSKDAAGPKIVIAPSGRSVVVTARESFGTKPSTGVLLWPDWRNSKDSIYFKQFRFAEFVTPHRVRLWNDLNDGSIRDVNHPDAPVDEKDIADERLLVYAGDVRTVFNERAWGPSPSRKFAMTWTDGLVPGEVHVHIRRTSMADWLEPIPEVPDGSILGWLAWD